MSEAEGSVLGMFWVFLSWCCVTVCACLFQCPLLILIMLLPAQSLPADFHLLLFWLAHRASHLETRSIAHAFERPSQILYSSRRCGWPGFYGDSHVCLKTLKERDEWLERIVASGKVKTDRREDKKKGESSERGWRGQRRSITSRDLKKNTVDFCV